MFVNIKESNQVYYLFFSSCKSSRTRGQYKGIFRCYTVQYESIRTDQDYMNVITSSRSYIYLKMATCISKMTLAVICYIMYLKLCKKHRLNRCKRALARQQWRLAWKKTIAQTKLRRYMYVWIYIYMLRCMIY